MSSYLHSAWWHFLYRLGLVKAKPWGRSPKYLTRTFLEPESNGLVKPVVGGKSVLHRSGQKPQEQSGKEQLDKKQFGKEQLGKKRPEELEKDQSEVLGKEPLEKDQLEKSEEPETEQLEQLEQAEQLDKTSERIAEIVVRPCLRQDYVVLDRVRRENRDWLFRWESMLPPNENLELPGFRQFCRRQDRAMCDGNALNMLIEVNGEVAGSVSIGAVQRESLSMGILGYWIAKKWANRGVTTLAVATVLDLVLIELDLHRVEIVVRPENQPSLAVCRKLGLREEGLRRRYMYIGGKWCDHLTFVADQEMLQFSRYTFVDRI